MAAGIGSHLPALLVDCKVDYTAAIADKDNDNRTTELVLVVLHRLS